MSPVWMIAPCPHYPDSGGIQRCGHSAWQWLTRSRPGSRLLGYGPECQADCLRSKPAAAVAAASYAGWRHPVLVWHHNLLQLSRLTWQSSRKTAVMLHGVEAWDPLPPAVQRQFAKTALVCTVSDYTWRRFSAANPAVAGKPHQTVHLGFEDGPLPLTTPSATPAAVIVARMRRDEDYKGHRELIAAWPQVQRRIPDAELWIIGGGDLQPELETLAGHNRNIRFLGRLPEAEKLAYLQRARCLAMPSRGEGFGLVYLEAMRAGRPCLVSDQDAGQEVVNPPEAGLSVDPHDSPACADALVRLLTDGPEWRQWAAAAQRRYQQHFTTAAFHRRLAEALVWLEKQ